MSLLDRLVSYAEYHRDKRNIATHFVGIPMIVIGTQSALARIGIGPINVAAAVTGLATRYYRAIDPSYGAAMGAILTATYGIGTMLAAMPLPIWAGTTAGLFFGGWALQFIGHFFEGKKPAFMDDLKGLLDGPLFLVAETAFALGFSKELRAEVERRAGPTRWGKVAEATAPAFAHAAAAN
ncbi:MAG TPA: Mpo1-like protein [Kofleriaceae bacterium]|nr:Mpo1-like protein [Kofleriaceae bacterium]